MHELDRPEGIAGDDDAAELVRVWIAHGELHVSMLLGALREEFEDGTSNEPETWGHLLADLTRHIANGLHQADETPQRRIIKRIRQEYIDNLADEGHSIEGSIVDDD